MRYLAIALGLTAAGCKPSPATTSPGTRGTSSLPVPWFAIAHLVAFRNSDITAYSIADTLVEVGHLHIADPADLPPGDLDGYWADHDHLFVKTAARAISLITVAGAVAVTVPPLSQLTAPQPTPSASSVELSDGGDGDLVVTPHAATWSRCAWGFAADGLQCEMFVHAQLWPVQHIERTPTPLTPISDGWSDVPPPAGFRTSVEEAALRCQPPSGAAVELACNVDQGEQIHSTHWLSASPPRLLVIYGTSGLADLIPTRWTLHDGCQPAPLAAGSSVGPGPRGLWSADESVDRSKSSRIVIWQRGRRVGELPAGMRVRFRPTN